VCRRSVVIQIAAVSIDPNKRATITTATGAQFEVNDVGMYPVQVSPTGRRLLQVRCQQRPPACPLPQRPPEWELAGPASCLRGWRLPWKHARSAQFNLR
jgi:hypothetical protein